MVSDSVAAEDRGFMYGDGLFTTYRIINGSVRLLPQHLQRLRDGANLLGIVDCDWNALEQQIAERAKNESRAVGKVIITRGEGGRGYACEGVRGPNIYIQHFSFPAHVYQQRKQGIDLHLAEFQLAIQPALAGIKHLNRLEQVLGRQEITQKGWCDAVFTDTSGHIVECNSANLFWRKDDVLYTSALDDGGVAGLMRAQVMAHCRQHQHRVEIVRAYPAVLDDADEIFTCNCVTGPVPVIHYANRVLPSHFLCRLLQKELDPLHD